MSQFVSRSPLKLGCLPLVATQIQRVAYEMFLQNHLSLQPRGVVELVELVSMSSIQDARIHADRSSHRSLRQGPDSALRRSSTL
eukprot:2779558-Amphidinium_carterae.1